MSLAELNAVLAKSKDEATQTFASVQNTLTDLREELTERISTAEDLGQQLKSVEADLQARTLLCQNLEAKLSSEKKEIGSLNEQCSLYVETISSLQMQLGVIESALQEAETEKNALQCEQHSFYKKKVKVTDTEDQVSKLKSTLEEVVNQRVSASDEVVRMQKEMYELVGQVADTTKALEEKDSAIGDLLRQVEDLKSSMLNLRKEKALLKEQLAAQQNVCEELSVQLQDMEQKTTARLMELDTLAIENKRLEEILQKEKQSHLGMVQTLEETIQKLVSENSTLTEKLTSALIGTSEVEVSTLSQEASHLQSQVQCLDEEKARSIEQISLILSQLKAVEEEKNYLIQEKTFLNQQLVQGRDQIAVLEKEKSSVFQELSALQTELSEVKTENAFLHAHQQESQTREAELQEQLHEKATVLEILAEEYQNLSDKDCVTEISFQKSLKKIKTLMDMVAATLEEKDVLSEVVSSKQADLQEKKLEIEALLQKLQEREVKMQQLEHCLKEERGVVLK
ncbi:hypothetical protein C0Q70_10698 [Pomacea canaliculata]|uniref:Uncharacterized protein n=1 Tax=Pomacea canaliculata TaxID=400727 RepID=A0A2T7P3Y1_POMCA|nr:hypothetical protein C0Q70_10698 [Pomacea canaliculata]